MHCVSLTTTKCLLKSTLYNPCSKFLVLDIKHFYYNTSVDRYKYMCLSLHSILDNIIAQYNLLAHPLDGWVYLNIRKVMSSLKQADIVTNNRLTLHLTKHVYAPVPRTSSLLAHAHLPMMFSLVVNDFGIKYTRHTPQPVHHLRRLVWIDFLWHHPCMGLRQPYFRRLHSRLH